jgi:ATP-dependent exoDNAse (exonuclease V) alpha subunit
MVRVDMFDAIDRFMRLNGKTSNKPFGGAQIIMFGDLYQLPPVVESEMGGVIKEVYQSPYFFSAKVMQHFKFKVINLVKVYRQKDFHFVEFLDKIRFGEINEESLEEVNTKIKTKQESNDFVTLAPTNKIVGAINQTNLDQIKDKLVTYKAMTSGDFNTGVNNLPVELEINLKKGAKVIFVKNDTMGRWVNGTLGKIIECQERSVKVQIDEDESIVDVGFVEWEKIKYEYDQIQKRIITKTVGKLIQIPLKLAWALTIHKCQGQTLEKVHIDITSGVWEHGQLYVALSRCKALEGISLERKIWMSDIKVDSRVVEFLKNKLNEPDVITSNEIQEETNNESKIELVGIVRKDIFRKRSAESGYQYCNFYLESGEEVSCSDFIPNIRKGWKVKIVGKLDKEKNKLWAESVERYVEKSNGKQLNLVEFTKAN